ncbi:MAG: acyl carrier protein [Planctomycetota bacterium]|jgi:acyl carrier protein
MDIEQRVKKVVAKQFKVNENEIKLESEFVKDLGAESIQSIELIALFEEEFDIEMDEQAALVVKTVGDAVEFIKKVIKENDGEAR